MLGFDPCDVNRISSMCHGRIALPQALWHKATVLAFERVAHFAAARAGALLRARYREEHEVTFKGEVDLVTATDREAEDLIVGTIESAFPDHGIIAEESSPRPAGSAYSWYVDPIDGTTNFAHGYPHFAVSIALEREQELILGVVYDPVREELFTAIRGQGARLNGRQIAVSQVGSLGESLVGTGFPYDRRLHGDFYLAFYREAVLRSQGVRRGGSAALDLSYVAAGRLDAFWEWKLKPWDVAAGRLLVEEAGGEVSDFSGGRHCLGGEETAASNRRTHSELLAMIRRVRGTLPPPA